MFRGFVALVSPAIIVTGVRIIKTPHANDAACAIHNGHTTSPTYNANCSSIIRSYFAGFAITLLGALVFVFTVAVMKRRQRRTWEPLVSGRDGLLVERRDGIIQLVKGELDALTIEAVGEQEAQQDARFRTVEESRSEERRVGKEGRS